jgi:undecaprenyl-diphosphatase
MSIFDALVLGLVQGLTEFIPVSSSGHLVIFHEILGTNNDSLAFDVALHVGTLIALLIYFRKDVWQLVKNLHLKNKDGRLARLLLISTIPAAVAGFFFGDIIDENLRSPMVVVITLTVVGIVMLLAERIAQPKEEKEVTIKQGMSVGFAQVLALVPGVSRSGVTMTAGRLVGMGRVQAARFSFLLAIPIIAGSALGVAVTENSAFEQMGLEVVVGMIASFVSGLLAIKFLLKVIGSVGLAPFAYYRFALAFIVLLTLV